MNTSTFGEFSADSDNVFLDGVDDLVSTAVFCQLRSHRGGFRDDNEFRSSGFQDFDDEAADGARTNHKAGVAVLVV